MQMNILTPIHIGNGNEKFPFEYRKRNNEYDCYNLRDLLGTVPSDKLLDPAFLDTISGVDSYAKQRFNKEFKNLVRYDKIAALYSLDIGIEIGNLNVHEQMKSLYRPIIPGSTIKGALENAIIYSYLKDNISIIKNKGLPEKRLDIETCISIILNKDVSYTKEFLNDIKRHLLCSDIYFEYMETQRGVRISQKKKHLKSQIPQIYECISPNQSYTGSFIQFSYKDLITKYSSKPEKELINYFKIENLKRSCNQYFIDVLKEESSHSIYKLFEMNGCSQINELIKKLYIQANKDDSILLRVGKNTDYYFKTIALLFKREFSEYYEKKFRATFSPIPKSNFINPHAMPTTRVVLEGFDELTLSGFLEIKINEEN